MSGEKTEEPTDKRLRDARAEGDIPKSTEVVSAAVVCAAAGCFIATAPSMVGHLLAAADFALSNAAAMSYTEALQRIGGTVLGAAFAIVAPVVACALSAALIALLAQTGFLVAPKAAIPKLKNLNPSRWFKQVFSKKNLFEFVKNIIKVTVLTIAVYQACKNHMRELFFLPDGSVGNLWTVCGSLFFDLAVYTLASFAALAAIDLAYTRLKYHKDHMMSHDEVKKEYKEMEGDPQIKQKRKQIHREMSNQNTVGKTRKAKVLIVNPTHYAVAIDYDRERTKLPVVVAKGEGDLARRMIEAAKEENIPIMRQPALARRLFAESREEDFVPKDLLMQVAEVLRIIAAAENDR